MYPTRAIKRTEKMKRIFDILLGVHLFLLLAAPILLISLAVRFSSKGPIIYWSDRIGKNNEIFRMPKFRTMLVGTPPVASHLLDNPDSHLSPIGKFLRRLSLDEFPQIFSVLKGDMSFVGPRPALFNQTDLIELRTKNGIDNLLPGVTGWAQVNGRDQVSIIEKVNLDLEYLHRQSFWFDLRILWITAFKVIKSEGLSH